MGWEIIFSPQAVADLESVVRFIAKDNPEAALRVGNALLDRVSILKDFPFIGSAYAQCSGVRKLVWRPYVIFYRVRPEERRVEILRYWRGARHEPEL
jgi:addiction module RelE/StbE family toxin